MDDETETPAWLKVLTIGIVFAITLATWALTILTVVSAISNPIGEMLMNHFSVGFPKSDSAALLFLFPCSVVCTLVSIAMLRDM